MLLWLERSYLASGRMFMRSSEFGRRAPCISLEYLANHSIDGFRGGLSVSLFAIQGTLTSGDIVHSYLSGGNSYNYENYGLNVTIVASTGCE